MGYLQSKPWFLSNFVLNYSYLFVYKNHLNFGKKRLIRIKLRPEAISLTFSPISFVGSSIWFPELNSVMERFGDGNTLWMGCYILRKFYQIINSFNVNLFRFSHYFVFFMSDRKSNYKITSKDKEIILFWFPILNLKFGVYDVKYVDMYG